MQTGEGATNQRRDAHVLVFVAIRNGPMTTPVRRASPQPPFESGVFYNLRYAGISSFDRLEWRRRNLALLCESHVFVCLSELRNSAAVVESSLMSHLPTHRSFYHCGPELPGQAIMVQRKWASTVSIGDPSRQDVDWGHEILVPGCMHMLWWITAGVLRGVINMYLNSHSAAACVQQLKAAVSKLSAFRQRRSHLSRCEFIFGGDRNFIMAPEHRLSSNPS